MGPSKGKDWASVQTPPTTPQTPPTTGPPPKRTKRTQPSIPGGHLPTAEQRVIAEHPDHAGMFMKFAVPVDVMGLVKNGGGGIKQYKQWQQHAKLGLNPWGDRVIENSPPVFFSIRCRKIDGPVWCVISSAGGDVLAWYLAVTCWYEENNHTIEDHPVIVAINTDETDVNLEVDHNVPLTPDERSAIAGAVGTDAVTVTNESFFDLCARYATHGPGSYLASFGMRLGEFSPSSSQRCSPRGEAVPPEPVAFVAPTSKSAPAGAEPKSSGLNQLTPKSGSIVQREAGAIKSEVSGPGAINSKIAAMWYE